ncbi:hypothetical protein ENBRE01_1071 [Enteropsectra breve]|nr:hypothetical protein ENBRE01_1071 [Enteropsectra breve]
MYFGKISAAISFANVFVSASSQSDFNEAEAADRLSDRNKECMFKAFKLAISPALVDNESSTDSDTQANGKNNGECSDRVDECVFNACKLAASPLLIEPTPSAESDAQANGKNSDEYSDRNTESMFKTFKLVASPALIEPTPPAESDAQANDQNMDNCLENRNNAVFSSSSSSSDSTDAEEYLDEVHTAMVNSMMFTTRPSMININPSTFVNDQNVNDYLENTKNAVSFLASSIGFVKQIKSTASTVGPIHQILHKILTHANYKHLQDTLEMDNLYKELVISLQPKENMISELITAISSKLETESPKDTLYN